VENQNNLNRRDFITRAVTATAAVSTAAISAAAETAPQHDSSRPLRIGCLNVSSYSHLPTLWGPLITARKGKQDTPFTNMNITHCWEIDRSKAEEFAAQYGCEVVDDFDGMLGKVDVIMSGGYYNHPWNHIIHEPYLEAGLPNLINRPFANSLAKAKKLLDMAKRNGAAILCPSGMELNDAIYRASAWAQNKNVICYNATNSFDDYPTHGVHGVYMICKAIAEAGFPVVSVAYQTRNWYSHPGILTFEHEDKNGRRFFGTLHQVSGSWATVSIHTPEEYGGKDFDVHTGTDYPFNKTEIWAPTVWAFQKMAMFGEMPQTLDDIYHKTNAFLAGWYSVLEKDGQPVKLAEVPEEWESPVELPSQPQDETVALFRAKFGA
jgi:hypothetical protein